MIVQSGPRSRSTGNLIDGVINRVTGVIATCRNGTTVGTFEEPMVLVVTLDTKPAFVYQPMVARAKQHQVIEVRLAPC